MMSLFLGLILMLPQTVINAGPNDTAIYKQIHERMGFDTYVDVSSSPAMESTTTNPFSGPSATDRWIIISVEIGKRTLMGKMPMGKGVSLQDAFNDLKKNHPYLFPEQR